MLRYCSHLSQTLIFPSVIKNPLNTYSIVNNIHYSTLYTMLQYYIYTSDWYNSYVGDSTIIN